MNFPHSSIGKFYGKESEGIPDITDSEREILLSVQSPRELFDRLTDSNLLTVLEKLPFSVIDAVMLRSGLISVHDISKKAKCVLEISQIAPGESKVYEEHTFSRFG